MNLVSFFTFAWKEFTCPLAVLEYSNTLKTCDWEKMDHFSLMFLCSLQLLLIWLSLQRVVWQSWRRSSTSPSLNTDCAKLKVWRQKALGLLWSAGWVADRFMELTWAHSVKETRIQAQTTKSHISIARTFLNSRCTNTCSQNFTLCTSSKTVVLSSSGHTQKQSMRKIYIICTNLRYTLNLKILDLFTVYGTVLSDVGKYFENFILSLSYMDHSACLIIVRHVEMFPQNIRSWICPRNRCSEKVYNGAGPVASC